MKSRSLILSLMASAIGALKLPTGNYNQFRGPTQSRKRQLNKEGLPRGYPGAKLARKAIQRAIAVKHPRGLRVNGVTV